MMKKALWMVIAGIYTGMGSGATVAMDYDWDDVPSITDNNRQVAKTSRTVAKTQDAQKIFKEFSQKIDTVLESGRKASAKAKKVSIKKNGDLEIEEPECNIQ